MLQSGITHVVYCQAFYSIKFFINTGSADVDICYLLHRWMCFCISSLVKSVVIRPDKCPAMQSDFATGSHSLVAIRMQLSPMPMHREQDQTFRKHKVTLITKQEQMQLHF